MLFEFWILKFWIMDHPDPRVFFISHLNSSSVRRSKLHKCVPKITIGLVFEVSGFVSMIFGSFHIELKRGTLILDSGGPASISRMKIKKNREKYFYQVWTYFISTQKYVKYGVFKIIPALAIYFRISGIWYTCPEILWERCADVGIP